MKSVDKLVCLNCGRAETVIPLVALRYDGEQVWICSQCLPVLIHEPQNLAGKMKNAERINSYPAD